MEVEYTFNGQREGEEVKAVINNHSYVLYPPGFKAVILLVLAAAVVIFWPSWYLVSVVIFLFTAVYLFRAIYAFKESIFIITDQRVFYVDQRGFFNRKIFEADLDKILDISSDTGGLARSMLKYGDIIIRTSGAREGGDIVIKNIPDPYNVQKIVTNQANYRLKP